LFIFFTDEQKEPPHPAIAMHSQPTAPPGRTASDEHLGFLLSAPAAREYEKVFT